MHRVQYSPWLWASLGLGQCALQMGAAVTLLFTSWRGTPHTPVEVSRLS